MDIHTYIQTKKTHTHNLLCYDYMNDMIIVATITNNNNNKINKAKKHKKYGRYGRDSIYI